MCCIYIFDCWTTNIFSIIFNLSTNISNHIKLDYLYLYWPIITISIKQYILIIRDRTITLLVRSTYCFKLNLLSLTFKNKMTNDIILHQMVLKSPNHDHQHLHDIQLLSPTSTTATAQRPRTITTIPLCSNYIRYGILLLSLLCLTSIMANIVAFNFSIMCMTKGQNDNTTVSNHTTATIMTLTLIGRIRHLYMIIRKTIKLYYYHR